MQNNLTDEQKADVAERTKLFEADLQELQNKHFIVVDSFPQYVPTEKGFTTISLVGLRDTKYAPVPSPFGKSDDGLIKES